jgi:hypothetical protein
MQRSPHSSASITLGVALLAFLMAGCAIIPVPVLPAQVDRFDDVHLANDVIVSAGPRRLIERLSKRLRKAYPDLTIVDPILFRDAAFPEGGWRLSDLIESGRCQQVAEDSDVQFLVLIGAGAAETGDEMGIMFPLVVPLAGVMTLTETLVLNAVVLDLKSGKPVCRQRSEATGVVGMAYWVIAFAAVVSMPSSALERGLANGIAEAIAEETDSAAVRVAIMAAEARGDPFVAYEGAPVTTGRDKEVGEIVNRLTDIEVDIIPGTTSLDEIRDRLGDPIASHSELGVDLYRLTAVAESETRPFIFLIDIDWKARAERRYAGYLLVRYDAASTVLDVASAFTAEVADPAEQPNPLESPTRSTYDYSFTRTASAWVTGFRVEVEHLGKDTLEAIYAEPDDVLVFENGEWSTYVMPRLTP